MTTPNTAATSSKLMAQGLEGLEGQGYRDGVSGSCDPIKSQTSEDYSSGYMQGVAAKSKQTA